jgi:hypothetical protein
MDMPTYTERIKRKMARHARIFDWCSDSWDSRVAAARTWRVVQRQAGRRISLREAMTE